MEITVVGSGSTGNCYRVATGGEAVLIECGLPVRRIKEGLDFRLSSISACFVSHEHGDHAKAAADLVRMGIPVYASPGTVGVLGIGRPITSPVTVGGFTVSPFPAVHDAADPVGFVVDHGSDRLVYTGDTQYVIPRFESMTHILLECNHSWEAIRAGDADPAVKRRVVGTHMSIETAIGFLRANDLSRVVEIVLVHLSDRHSLEDDFKRRIQEATGKVVRVA